MTHEYKQEGIDWVMCTCGKLFKNKEKLKEHISDKIEDARLRMTETKEYLQKMDDIKEIRKIYRKNNNLKNALDNAGIRGYYLGIKT